MVLVCGATGYTGYYVVSALVKQGVSVRCLVRNPDTRGILAGLDVEIVAGDLERSEDVVAALEDVDVFVNVAHIRFASSLVPLLEASRVQKSVFFSSTWRLSRFLTPEVQSVIDGERALESSALNTVILRPSMIYGPGDDRNISRLRNFVDRGWVMPIFGSGNQLVQPVYVTDVANAVVACLERDEISGRTYEIAGDYPITYSEMIDVLCRLVGSTILKVYVPVFLALPFVQLASKAVPSLGVRVDQIRRMKEDRAFDITSARKDLKFQPMGFEEGAALAVGGGVEGIA
jgi:nucleoside-diphosphate-sugar epimerase